VRLVDRYDAFLLDLDGVVYRGDDPVPGAPQAVAALREAGRRVIFLTNNSARTPDQVSERLSAMGVPATPRDVVTSAEATATLVVELVARESRPPTAFVIGEGGIREALAAAGLELLDGEPPEAGFVVVGWDRGADYAGLRTATLLVSRGARLVATNADASFPAPGGEMWPGAGALLAAVETASGERATVVGKPHRPLFDAAVQRAGRGRALVVGDRIETDVAGGLDADLDAALVLTGAHGPADLLDRDPLPTVVLAGLGDLMEDWPEGRVRRPQSDELEAVRALVKEAGLAAQDLEAREAVVLEAEEDLLASASAAVREGEAYLHSVAVRRDVRGHHLGTLTVAAATRRAAAGGARRAYLLTEDAEGFFGRLGFERIDRTDLPAWVTARSTACSSAATAMRRALRRAQ
jgi:HAD superfamily hydrolase (TIGR01450 family)